MSQELKGREQFRKVDTGNGIDRNLAATTVDRLELTVIELQNLQANNTHQTEKLEMAIGSLGTELMMLRHDVKSLNKTITEANNKNDRMQKWFLTLAIVGTFLALSGVIQAIDIFVRGIGK